MEFQVHIFLVVHPKQTVMPTQKIQLNDLKGGAGINQYVDNILAIRRIDRCDNLNNTEVEVSILKNRMFGIEDTIKLIYNHEVDGIRS